MIIKDAKIKPSKEGYEVILLTDAPLSEIGKWVDKVKNGHTEIECAFPHNLSTVRQKSFLWAKINLLADSIGASKEEVYELMLKRYGKGEYLVISPYTYTELRKIYRFIDILKDDGDLEVVAYKGIEYMDSRELSTLIDGVLSEL